MNTFKTVIAFRNLFFLEALTYKMLILETKDVTKKASIYLSVNPAFLCLFSPGFLLFL